MGGYIVWEQQRRTNANKKYLEEKEKEVGVVKLSSGLLYRVLEKGEGLSHPTSRSSCSCNYTGTLIDGKEFDSSPAGKPAILTPVNLIKGFSDALKLMVEGDVWEVYVPTELGYNQTAHGSIPGCSTLIFKVELLQIHGQS